MHVLVLTDPRYSAAGWADRPATQPRESGGIAGAWRRRSELRKARALADAELLQSAFTTPRTAWRAAEVTSAKNRVALAGAIRRVVGASDARKLPGATPLNRIAVREQAETLNALADRLTDLDRRVTARGVLLIDRLVSDGYGPLYVSYRAVELRDALEYARAALEGDR